MTTVFLVAADWLAEHIDDPEIQILDARMAPPGQGDHDVGGECRADHIPDAVFFDIEMLPDRTSLLSHIIPRPEAFTVVIHEPGVNQDGHLVIYNDGNLFSVPRAWWMLRTFGVGNVSILADDLADWKHGELMLKEGDEDLPESELNMTSTSDTVVCITDVLLTSHEETAQVVDAYPVVRFNDKIDKLCPGLKHGHVPDVLNVPWTELVRDGELKTIDELDAIFSSYGVNFDRLIITSYGSSVTAAVVVLTLTTLGVTGVTLHDGAWSEQGARNDLLVEPQL